MLLLTDIVARGHNLSLISISVVHCGKYITIGLDMCIELNETISCTQTTRGGREGAGTRIVSRDCEQRAY